MPAEARRTFTIQVADDVSGFLLPRRVQCLGKEAPGVSIDFLPFTISKEIVWDRIDMQVRLTPGRLQPEMMRSQGLAIDAAVVLMPKDHPRAGNPMTAKLYSELPRVKLSQSATGSTVIKDVPAACAAISRSQLRAGSISRISWRTPI